MMIICFAFFFFFGSSLCRFCSAISWRGDSIRSVLLFSAPLPLGLRPYKLIRSMLSLSPLRTLLTTPNLKKRSSPPAVLPPMYIRSAPVTSRKPSDELSLPRLRGWGIGMPRGGCNRPAWWEAAAAAACAAAVAMPREEDGLVDGVDTEYEAVVVDEEVCLLAEVVVDCCGGEEEDGRGEPGCWRKAAKKPERKNGRWGDMVELLTIIVVVVGGGGNEIGVVRDLTGVVRFCRLVRPFDLGRSLVGVLGDWPLKILLARV